MSGPVVDTSFLNNIPAYIAAVGALGLAAFGMVEAVGKTVMVFRIPGTRHTAGLPYVGFGKIRALIKKVRPALKACYGDDYEDIIEQQYRAGRGGGQAPDTIRQGVRLGLPFLGPAGAAEVIEAIWGMPRANSEQLAAALTDRAAAAGDQADAQALAARFATALDTRVQAAFDVAEEVYETRAQFWAAMVAVGLSLAYQGATTGWKITGNVSGWVIALLVGLVAVPLAPAAKDLSSSLSSALGALSKIRGGGK